MKLPVGFNKMTNEEQRAWVAERLQNVRNEEKELTEMYRRLVTSPVSIKVDERPDLIDLKPQVKTISDD